MIEFFLIKYVFEIRVRDSTSALQGFRRVVGFVVEPHSIERKQIYQRRAAPV